ASCWNTNPNYNRWFYFVATTPFVTVTVDRGGIKGTLQRANVAIWESDGLTEVACNRYVYNADDVSVGYITLTVGNTYYISVDNSYSGYRGTFTLCVDNGVDYDYYEGAKIITDISNWCSNNGEYTTIGATPDKNAGSCWNTNPDYNRWFAFQATNTEKVTITVLRGGSYGTIQRINAALWESDGITQVACNRYVNNGDNVTIQVSGLTEGNWYYLSVDNNYACYRGTFTLCFDDGRMQWTGTIDIDWDEPGNWSYAYVPTFFDDILIPSGLTNYPETNTGNDGMANSMLMEPGTRLTIPTGKALTISNDFDMEADASAMSSMIDNGTINNDVTQTSYQCYLSEDQWHLVSAPVSGAQSAVFTNIYLKYFTELDSTWTYIVPINHNLLPGQGFSAWASSALTGSTTVTYEGGFNTGDQIPPPLTYNVGLGAGDGWNLIGNPFPSALEWNTNWTTNNIDASIYVYDGNTGQYLTWNRNLGTGTMPNGEVPPAQGFWAKANGPSPSITIPHSERVHTSQGFYKSGSHNALQILVKGNGFSDKLLVYFNKSATAGFDSEYDAYKLNGIVEAPQIYTTAEGIDLTLNTLPAEPKMIIPMGFEMGVEGNYQIIAKELGNLDEDDEFYLEDKLLHQIILLTENDIYDFSASPNDDPDRFNLHFIFNNTNPITVDDPNKVNIYSIEKEIFVHISGPTNCKIFVYNLMGQLVAEGNGYDNSLTKFKIDSKTGIYIVKVIDKNKVYSEKVYIE
ncbi:MAG: T9SS type A sorting domain-containing protein, partial [Bacteroidales bacterium]|nr:T9SS type A sorting domain-containing protein [Bacteroidales bacterium]